MNLPGTVGRGVGVFVAAVLLGAAPLAPAVQFFDITQDGAGGFLNALPPSFLLGVETFPSSTIGVNQEVALEGPVLAPGEANGPFPEGTQPSLGITLQVNTLGATPSSLNPGGLLFALGPGVDDAGYIRVGPENAAHSLDILIEPPGFLGDVTGFRLSLFATAPTAEVRVYNTANDLLGLATISGLGAQSREIGLVASGEDVMFRVNLWSADGWAEAGDLHIYAVPEPSTWALFLAGLAGMAWLRIRRRRTR